MKQWYLLERYLYTSNLTSYRTTWDLRFLQIKDIVKILKLGGDIQEILVPSIPKIKFYQYNIEILHFGEYYYKSRNQSFLTLSKFTWFFYFVANILSSIIRSSQQMCFVKKDVLRILQNSQEKTCARASFLRTLFYRSPLDDCFFIVQVSIRKENDQFSCIRYRSSRSEEF